LLPEVPNRRSRCTNRRLYSDADAGELRLNPHTARKFLRTESHKSIVAGIKMSSDV